MVRAALFILLAVLIFFAVGMAQADEHYPSPFKVGDFAPIQEVCERPTHEAWLAAKEISDSAAHRVIKHAFMARRCVMFPPYIGVEIKKYEGVVAIREELIFVYLVGHGKDTTSGLDQLTVIVEDIPKPKPSF